MKQIDLSQVYNIDETRFSIGKLEFMHVIVDSTCQTKYQSHLSHQEWDSSIE